MKKDNKRTKEMILIILLSFILCIGISIIFSLMNIGNPNILNGISINKIEVSNMSKENANNLINLLVNRKKNNPITIKIENGPTFSYNFKDLDITYNILESINDAYNIGRTDNIIKNNFTILNLIFKKQNLEMSTYVNETKIDDIILDINASLENAMIQSEYYIDGENLIINKGKNGNYIDKDIFKECLNITIKNIAQEENIIELKAINTNPKDINIDEIYKEICKDAKDAYYTQNPFKVYIEEIGYSFDKNQAKELLKSTQEEYVIPLNITYPNITVNDLDIDIFRDLISTFETKYNVSNIDRVTNLKLAASKIDGTILLPQEEFSYNKTVGARTIRAGYKEASIYSNGEVVEGIGGGICQISSTLYNSAVFSNFQITERHAHQFITSYVDLGRDATVSYGAKDLKFINTRSYPIKIKITVEKGIVKCSIYGLKEETEYNVDFEIENIDAKPPHIIYEKDENLKFENEYVKQMGANGATVNVYKITKLNNEIISKELLSHDNYMPIDKIIVRGINR